MARPDAAPAPATVPVSVVVVDWNAGTALEACVASVLEDAAAELVLVDNGSTDGSAARVRARHPALRLLETGENLGFAAGANRGAAAARGEVLVFLNPDARVLPGAIGRLVGALAAVPGAGIAGGGLADADGRWQPAAARFAPVAHLLLDTTLGRLPARRWRAPRRVDWVYGTFMAVRREVFERLGGFDPRYFLYGEDMDLCWRAARLGIGCLVVPAARAVHGANVSARTRFGSGREAEVVKGEMRFYAARAGRTALAAYRAVALLKFGAKAALARATGRRGPAETYARVVSACVGFRPEGARDG
jgi:N-acetylglucosaminyl-diphospho-decaprenol L-rhamnosyltransferase